MSEEKVFIMEEYGRWVINQPGGIKEKLNPFSTEQAAVMAARMFGYKPCKRLDDELGTLWVPYDD